MKNYANGFFRKNQSTGIKNAIYVVLAIFGVSVLFKFYKGFAAAASGISGLFGDDTAAPGDNATEQAQNTLTALAKISPNYKVSNRTESYCQSLADSFATTLYGIGGIQFTWTVKSDYKNVILPGLLSCNYMALQAVVKHFGLRSTGLFTPAQTLMGFLTTRYKDDFPEYLTEIKPMFKAAGFSL